MDSLDSLAKLITLLKENKRLLIRQHGQYDNLDARITTLERQMEGMHTLKAHEQVTSYLLELNSVYALQKEEISMKMHALLGTKVTPLYAIGCIIADIPAEDNIALLQHDLQSYGRLRQSKLYQLPPLRKAKQDGQWNLELTQAYDAQELSQGEGMRVGVIDTGVDYEHKELKDNFDPLELGYNFTNDTDDPFDDHNHGTHVAGTIAGSSVGIATKAQLYALKVLTKDGWGTEANVLKAMDWAISKKLDAINLSLGSSSYSTAEEAMCKAAYDAGVAVIAAAGNSGGSDYHYPASLPYVVSVAAVDAKLQHAYFSTYNDMVDICAPGVNVKSCIPRNRYDSYDGTSMATPHIAGAFALVKSYVQEHTPKTLEEALKTSAKELGDKHKYGEGFLQIMEMIST